MYDLLQLMYQDGALSSTELTALRKTCRDMRENPVRVLRSLNIVSQPEIQGFLQRFYGIDAATDELVSRVDGSLEPLLPVDLALNYSAACLGEEDGHLLVLLEDPTDARTLRSLEFFLGRPVRPIVATAIQIARSLTKIYGAESGEMHLTTVLEAARGVQGGSVYDPSQLTPFSKDDELLVDKGERYETLRETLREGTLGLSAGRGAKESMARSRPEPTLAPPLSEADPETLAAHVAASHFDDEPAHAVVAPVEPALDVLSNGRSVFEDFAGMETLEAIDSELADANESLLGEAPADDETMGGEDDLADFGGDTDAMASLVSGELSLEAKDASSDDGGLGLGALAALEGDAWQGSTEGNMEENRDEPPVDDVSLEALGGSELEDDLLVPEPRTSGSAGRATAVLAEAHSVASRRTTASRANALSPTATKATAPMSAALSGVVSRVLLKLATARTFEDALMRANDLLILAGFRIERGPTGAVVVEETASGVRIEVAGPGDLELLTPETAPLSPVLRQLFRARASA